ncbi:hypothetical protein KIL84_016310 [Mauremys mutica]|uniref:Uncharacterized protein n=1 Tax=Mauremys mutica TaxID=74926 RepID=A0A9D3WTN6_9SAUR|nr:hypothetical protein KIL84_016310 [Mauremys mutica]
MVSQYILEIQQFRVPQKYQSYVKFDLLVFKDFVPVKNVSLKSLKQCCCSLIFSASLSVVRQSYEKRIFILKAHLASHCSLVERISTIYTWQQSAASRFGLPPSSLNPLF